MVISTRTAPVEEATIFLNTRLVITAEEEVSGYATPAFFCITRRLPEREKVEVWSEPVEGSILFSAKIPGLVPSVLCAALILSE